MDRRFIHEDLVRNLIGIREKKITICGCGALGGWAAHHLARMGFRTLVLIDDGLVEAHNPGTQPYQEQDVGAHKAHILAGDPVRVSRCQAEPMLRRLDQTNATKMLRASTIVLDVFDNHDSRECVRAACEALKLPCVHAGMSGEGTGLVQWNEGYRTPMDTNLPDPCAYPLGLALVQLTAMVAAEAVVRFLLSGEQIAKLILRDRLEIIDI